MYAVAIVRTARKYKLEHLIGKFRKLTAQQTKPRKESNMANLDITVDELGAGDMCARGVSIIINGISAEDATRVSLRFLLPLIRWRRTTLLLRSMCALATPTTKTSGHLMLASRTTPLLRWIRNKLPCSIEPLT